jgi:hypothetical protein
MGFDMGCNMGYEVGWSIIIHGRICCAEAYVPGVVGSPVWELQG